MEKFDAVKYFKTIFWVVLACAIGVGTQIAAVSGPDGFQLSDVDWTPLGMGAFLWGAIRSTIGWANANRPEFAPLKKVLSIMLVAGLAFALAACGTLRPALGDHSATEVTFKERTQLGDDTEIKIRATGEAAQTAGVKYKGQTENADQEPWSLEVAGNQQVTSPQARDITAGIGSAIQQTPGTLTELAGQLASFASIPGLGGGSGEGPAPSILRPFFETMLGSFFSRLGLPVP